MKNYITFVLILICQQVMAQMDAPVINNNISLTKQLLKNLLIQNQMTNDFALNQVSNENISMRLNDKAASVGFMYRHIGETIHLFGTFLGEQTSVKNTTMGQQDMGQVKNFEESKQLLTSGFALLQNIIDKNTDAWWMEEIETPFFGKVNRFRLFSHILYHNAHHSGQISLTLSKGTKTP